MKKALVLLGLLGLMGATSAFAVDSFANVAGSGTDSETGVKTVIQSLQWILAFLPFAVAGVFGGVAYKKAKENSDREDNTKELAMKTTGAVILGIVFMIIVYGFVGKALLGATTFGGGWSTFVTSWWAGVFNLQ